MPIYVFVPAADAVDVSSHVEESSSIPGVSPRRPRYAFAVHVWRSPNLTFEEDKEGSLVIRRIAGSRSIIHQYAPEMWASVGSALPDAVEFIPIERAGPPEEEEPSDSLPEE